MFYTLISNNLNTNKMKNSTHLSTRLCTAKLPDSLPLKSILVALAFLLGLLTTVSAQEAEYAKPSWYFGVAGGANFNFYRGTTQTLNSDLTVLSPFHNGDGVGLFVAPMLEYHKYGTMLGFMIQAGLDSREGSFNRVTTYCNCPTDLETDLSYITVEPSLRIAPFKNSFYIYGGPRLAFNTDKTFTYKMGVNPDVPEQVAQELKGDFSNIENTIFSMQVGAGYDIALSSNKNKTQFVLSPFVAFHPYFGQEPRSIESWTVTTVRAGVVLKFGQGRLVTPAKEEVIAPKPLPYTFIVNSPENSTTDPVVRETFPIRNYVFFDEGSTEIPNRYATLKKSEVQNFKEDQLETYVPKNMSGRADRNMTVYYNILNILGDRMQKHPSSKISLIGSSEKGPADGKLMAESVKTYLTGVFAIAPARITVEGRSKPKLPSKQVGGVLELELLSQDDRRVSIETNSPELIMEFSSGPNAPLKPVEYVIVQEAPLSSYLTLEVDGANEAFSTWSVEVKDESNKTQYFGPYTEEKVSIPGEAILGTRAEGDYFIALVGTSPDGSLVREEQKVHMVLWQPSVVKESKRFSIIHEFDDAKAIQMYDKYLTEVVAPKIPTNGHVVINGHTDVIGDAENNNTLSLARANDTKMILQKSLTAMGRSDVTFEVIGNGENNPLFGNKLPEERFYNRSVVIDVFPKK